MENQVSVRCRAQDEKLVRSVLGDAAQKYSTVIKQATGANLQLNLTVDNQKLPADSCGGVILACQGGQILVDNTLDARLRLCMESERPQLREMLFFSKK